MRALLRLLPNYLIWPKPGSDDYRIMRREIEQDTEFPGCVGFLDGTDIGIMHACTKLPWRNQYESKEGIGSQYASCL